jgi:DMSO/TMAO reductase YedYZ heme-binding membrane subunit
VAAVAAIVHFIWGQKSDIRLPLEYAAVLALLLCARVYLTWQKRFAHKRRPFPPPGAKSPPEIAL